MAHLDSITLNIGTTGVDSGTCFLRLTAADGDGYPSGSVLAESSTIELGDLIDGSPTQYTTVEFEFDVDIDKDTWYDAEIILTEVVEKELGEGWYVWIEKSGYSWSPGDPACSINSDESGEWYPYGELTDVREPYTSVITIDDSPVITVSQTGGGSAFVYGYNYRSCISFNDLTELAKPINPTPENEDTGVDFSDFTLAWENGGGATSYDISIGPDELSMTLVSERQSELSYVTNAEELATLFGEWPPSQKVYWEVDAWDDADNTVTGDVWTFTPVLTSINTVRLGAGGSFILCTTTTGLYLSTNFGSVWINVLPDAGETTEWDKGICSGTGTYIISERKSDGVLYRSGNTGSTWATITPAGADTFTVNDMKMSESGQYVVIVGTNGTTQANSCYTSADYGVTWTVRNPTTAYTLAWTTCDISDNGQIIMVGATGDLYVTFNGGILWKKQNPPASNYWWESAGISGDGKIGVIVNTGTANEWFKNSGWNDLATVTTTPFTATGRSIVGAANAAAANTVLGLGTTDSPSFAGLTLTGTDLAVSSGGTGASTFTDGGLLVGAAAGPIEALAVGTTAQILVGGGSGTNPAWGTDIPTAVTIGSKYVYRAEGTDVPVADGGTGKSVFAVGDIIHATGTTTLAGLVDVAVGSYLRSGGVTTVPLWSTLILPNEATAFRLPVATSANTIGELAAVGATGEYLKGNTGAVPSWATLNQAAVAGLTTADSPVFAGLTLSATQEISILNTTASGDIILDLDITQGTNALTGTLRGVYSVVTNGAFASSGTIRAFEGKARAATSGLVGGNVGTLEGMSLTADAKNKTITTLRGAEIIMDGQAGAAVTLATGLRISNNFQANIATTSYGLHIHRDSFDYTADILLSKGGTITGDSYLNQDCRIATSPTFAGLTLTGTLLLNNSVSFQYKDSSGTPKALLTRYSDDNVYFDNIIANKSIVVRVGGGVNNTTFSDTQTTMTHRILSVTSSDGLTGFNISENYNRFFSSVASQNFYLDNLSRGGLLVCRVSAASDVDTTICTMNPAGPITTFNGKVRANTAFNLNGTDFLTSTGLAINGTAKLGDGGTTNYANFAADGELNLYGTARVLNSEWIGASSLKAAGAKPATEVIVGALESHAWNFADVSAANEQSLSFKIRLHRRRDTSVASTITLNWSSTTADPGDNTAKAYWRLEYTWRSANEAMDPAAETTIYANPIASTTSKGLVRTDISIATLPSATDVLMLCRLTRQSADALDTIADDVRLHGITASWITNKLGTAT